MKYKSKIIRVVYQLRKTFISTFTKDFIKEHQQNYRPPPTLFLLLAKSTRLISPTHQQIKAKYGVEFVRVYPMTLYKISL